MKVNYINERNAYLVQLEDCENVTFVNTDDIVEARKYFIEHMMFLFNSAINQQLKAEF